MRKIFLGFVFATLAMVSFAQDSTARMTGPHPAGLRSDGKMYVVLAVAVTILIGLFIYLIRLDKKISSIEKQLPSK